MALLDGRRVLITGAARGIGLAAATTMLEQGARVMLTDRDGDALAASVKALAPHGDQALQAEMDVCDPEAVATVLARVADHWSGLDVLVNNAAMLDIGDTRDIALDRWRAVLETNLTSALAVSQAALPLLRAGTDPAIVNTVSTQAFFGQPDSVAYASAKGGLMNLTRCMANDLGAEGIRVNAVAPGFIDTRMAQMADGGHEHDQPEFRQFYLDMGRIPLRRPGTAEDCAGAFVFLASDLSRYITGQAIFVDGGLSATY